MSAENIGMKEIKLFLGVIALLFCSLSSASIITVNAVDSGNYSDFGQHFEGNPNYAVGVTSTNFLRNFFVFDLSSVNGTITDASLRLYSGAVGGSDVYSLYEVSTDINVLTSGHARNDPIGLSIYADLGAGLSFGSTVIQDRSFSIVDIALNSAAISSLNISSGLVAMGGAYPDGTANHAFFSTGSGNETKQLILNVAALPEPGTLWLLVIGFASIAWVRRRRIVSVSGHGGITMRRFILALILATFAATANAVSITIQFTGVVTGSRIVEGPDEGLPMPGAPVSGSLIQGQYSYESTTPDSAVGCESCGSIGFYDAITDATWSIGELEYQLGDNSGIHIENGSGSGTNTRDLYGIDLVRPVGPTIGEYDELMVFDFTIFDFEGGPDPDMLSDDSLPAGAPDMSLATDALGIGPEGLFKIITQYQSSSTGIRAQILGHLTSIETVRLVEPGTLGLFCIGLAGMGLARRRKIT